MKHHLSLLPSGRPVVACTPALHEPALSRFVRPALLKPIEAEAPTSPPAPAVTGDPATVQASSS
jgi:hypothetical protein